MNHLFKPILVNTFKRKSVWLYWCFALSPFLVMIAMTINSNFLKVSGEEGTLSGAEFYTIIYGVLHNSTLPIIILAFIIASLFYEEINDGILFMFKDISKRKILLSKWLTIWLMQLIFMIILFFSAVTVYFLFLSNFDFASGNLMPLKKDLAVTVVPIMGMYFVEIITINVAIALSINLSTGWTILGSLVFLLFTTIAPYLNIAKFIVPNGYESFIGNIGLLNIVMIISAIFLIYFVISYLYSNYRYKNVEY